MPWTAAQAKQHYKKLTKKQSEVWAQVANSSLEAGDDDATAIKKANAAVNRMKHKEALAQSAFVVLEVGRMISAANMKTLQNALVSMKDAVSALEPLIADDAEESVDIIHSNSVIDQEIDPILKEVFTKAPKWETRWSFEETTAILAQQDSYDSKRSIVQSALRRRAMQDALAQKVADGSDPYDYYYEYGACPWIRDLYDNYVVYSLNGDLYQCEYTIANGEATLGDPTEVQISYVPTESRSTVESKSIVGDLITLEEKAVHEDGTLRIKLINPGWGSSGYYSKEMLKRDGPKVFKNGLHMYMDHPTEQEAKDRPERSVRDLVGTLVEDAKWEDASSSNTGDGLYANARVYSQYKDFVDQASKDIGVSIRASGYAEEGEAEERHGYIINSLTEGFSVDYVTLAGRGGEVLSLFESARNKHNKATEVNITENKGEVIVVDISAEELNALKEAAAQTPKLVEQLAEANKNITRMSETLILGEARTIITEMISATTMHAMTKTRLIGECMRNIPTTDGILDKDKLKESVKEAITEEAKYLEGVGSSVTGGRVVGMNSAPVEEVTEADIDKQLESAFGGFGLGESARKLAAVGRN